MIEHIEIRLNPRSTESDSLNLLWALLDPDFELVRLIGLGGMGSVYLIQKRSSSSSSSTKDNSPGKSYALKIIQDPPMTKRATQPKEIPTEVHIMKHKLPKLDFLIQCTAAFGLNKTWMLLLEHCPSGDLQDLNLRYIQSNHRLPEAFIWHVFFSASQAIYAAHSRGVIHRDIKPANFLLGETTSMKGKYPHVKLADWGLAALRTDPGYCERTSAGTKAFRCHDDPGLADEKCDVWAVGATVHCLMFGNLPPVRYPCVDRGRYSRFLYDAMRDCVEFCYEERLSSEQLARKMARLAPRKIERGYLPLR